MIRFNKFYRDWRNYCENRVISVQLFWVEPSRFWSLLAASVEQVAFVFSVLIWNVIYSSKAFTYLERGEHQQVFEQRPCSLSLPTAGAAMQSDPGPLCLYKVESHSVLLMEQSTTGGDYSLPLVHFNSPAPPCYYFRRTCTHTHAVKTECTDLHSRTHSSSHVSGIAEAIISDWMNLWAWNKKQGCVSVYSSVELRCLEWPVDKLYPMSYVNHHRVIRGDSE